MHNKNNRIQAITVEGFVFLLSSLLLSVYSLILHKESQADWKMSAYLFPLVIAVFLFLLSISLLLEGKKERLSQEAQEQESNNTIDNDTIQEQKEITTLASMCKNPWKDAALFALLSLLYIMCINLVGFLVSTGLFLVASFAYLKERRVAVIIVLSIVFTLVVYVLFGMVLHVMLP
ncbi:MAG TPA: tripartite tricarboxylate transporter TctB family protein [Sphaerochaeta sp.]|nr:tripartite tricarboxylate transporter TctB family protein [Sphaerochaeta sp.]